MISKDTDIVDLKNHALRALCGLLMNRDSSPFSGGDYSTHLNMMIDVRYLESKDNSIVIMLYFNQVAEGIPEDAQDIDIVQDWAVRVWHKNPWPQRLALVQLLGDGTYVARYGTLNIPINIYEDDFDIDPMEGFELTRDHIICDPEPQWTEWQYWESEVTEKQTTFPIFLCKRLRNEWWVIDIDRKQKVLQQVAGLRVAQEGR